MSAVVAHRLRRVFGDGAAAVTAVDDISLGVDRGEVLLLLGPSGSGKTTLVSMLAGLLQPSDGWVEVMGRRLDAGAADTSAFRLRTIGFVFQSFNLLPTMTALENVALPLRLRGVARREAERRAAQLLAELAMAQRAVARISVLSGGERQRVSLARALIGEPAVLLADEPTASLDTTTGHEAMRLIVERARSGGHACVVVTHDTRLTDFADRILHIEDGRVSEAQRTDDKP